MVNNKYLLDTHSLIWFQKNNPRLSKQANSIIQNTSNIILFSQISLFELAIKQKIGKIPQFMVTIDEVNTQAIYDGFTFVAI